MTTNPSPPTILSVLILKHIKQESNISQIEIVLDSSTNELKNISLHEKYYKLFKSIHGNKNVYRFETDNGDIILLDLMKNLRNKQWQLMTSHSFTHFAIQKIIESNFYFERAAPSSSSSSSLAASVVLSSSLSHPEDTSYLLPTISSSVSREEPRSSNEANIPLGHHSSPTYVPSLEHKVPEEKAKISDEKVKKAGAEDKMKAAAAHPPTTIPSAAATTVPASSIANSIPSNQNAAEGKPDVFPTTVNIASNVHHPPVAPVPSSNHNTSQHMNQNGNKVESKIDSHHIGMVKPIVDTEKSKPVADPEVMAFILDKSGQARGGPYAFATRPTVAGQLSKTKKEAAIEESIEAANAIALQAIEKSSSVNKPNANIPVRQPDSVVDSKLPTSSAPERTTNSRNPSPAISRASPSTVTTLAAEAPSLTTTAKRPSATAKLFQNLDEEPPKAVTGTAQLGLKKNVSNSNLPKSASNLALKPVEEENPPKSSTAPVALDKSKSATDTDPISKKHSRLDIVVTETNSVKPSSVKIAETKNLLTRKASNASSYNLLVKKEEEKTAEKLVSALENTAPLNKEEAPASTASSTTTITNKERKPSFTSESSAKADQSNGVIPAVASTVPTTDSNKPVRKNSKDFSSTASTTTQTTKNASAATTSSISTLAPVTASAPPTDERITNNVSVNRPSIAVKVEPASNLASKSEEHSPPNSNNNTNVSRPSILSTTKAPEVVNKPEDRAPVNSSILNRPSITVKTDEPKPEPRPLSSKSLSFKLFGGSSASSQSEDHSDKNLKEKSSSYGNVKAIEPSATNPTPTNHSDGGKSVPVYRRASDSINKLFNKYQPKRKSVTGKDEENTTPAAAAASSSVPATNTVPSTASAPPRAAEKRMSLQQRLQIDAGLPVVPETDETEKAASVSSSVKQEEETTSFVTSAKPFSSPPPVIENPQLEIENISSDPTPVTIKAKSYDETTTKSNIMIDIPQSDHYYEVGPQSAPVVSGNRSNSSDENNHNGDERDLSPASKSQFLANLKRISQSGVTTGPPPGADRRVSSGLGRKQMSMSSIDFDINEEPTGDAFSGLPQLALKKKEEPVDEEHESSRTQHYSKLGSAFVSGNVLNRSGRGNAGRGGGRGRGF